MNFFRSLLSHPLTRGMDIDSPGTTEIRRKILEDKEFLHKVYSLWYNLLAGSLPDVPGKVLELGSGAGFLEKHIPGVISSEVFYCQHVALVLNGLQLPLQNHSLSAIVMSDVFHHLPQPRQFIREAGRCVRSGGVISMIEPWVTPWSSLVFTRFHHEPFDPDAADWEFPPTGPLSGANQAIPWMIFRRDLLRFRQEFPEWKVEKVEPFMPFCYLMSGGISLRSFMPGWSFGFWQSLERSIFIKPDRWAMFAHIILRRM